MLALLMSMWATTVLTFKITLVQWVVGYGCFVIAITFYILILSQSICVLRMTTDIISWLLPRSRYVGDAVLALMCGVGWLNQESHCLPMRRSVVIVIITVPQFTILIGATLVLFGYRGGYYSPLLVHWHQYLHRILKSTLTHLEAECANSRQTILQQSLDDVLLPELISICAEYDANSTIHKETV